MLGFASAVVVSYLRSMAPRRVLALLMLLLAIFFQVESVSATVFHCEDDVPASVTGSDDGASPGVCGDCCSLHIHHSHLVVAGRSDTAVPVPVDITWAISAPAESLIAWVPPRTVPPPP